MYFCCQRVLSAEHGAYLDFMAELRDSIIIINQNNFDDCVNFLKDGNNISHEQITNKIVYDFDWFLCRFC